MSAIDDQQAKIEITIPSDTLAGQAVQDQIIRRLEELTYGDHDLFGIRLALEEALVNAIKHGNRLDPQKSVRIAWQVDSATVRIEIEDEGEGFNPEEVPDPTADEESRTPLRPRDSPDAGLHEFHRLQRAWKSRGPAEMSHGECRRITRFRRELGPSWRLAWCVADQVGRRGGGITKPADFRFDCLAVRIRVFLEISFHERLIPVINLSG